LVGRTGETVVDMLFMLGCAALYDGCLSLSRRIHIPKVAEVAGGL
jgi:hypothetical protein